MIVRYLSFGKWVPWAIALFFVVQTALFACFAYVAKQTDAGMSTTQAYEKGLSYNSIIKKSEEQEALLYTSKIEYKNGQIFFSLENEKGQKIQDAKVWLWLYRPVHAGKDIKLEMEINSFGGGYAVNIAPPEKGLWEARIHAQTRHGSYQDSKRILIE